MQNFDVQACRRTRCCAALPCARGPVKCRLVDTFGCCRMRVARYLLGGKVSLRSAAEWALSPIGKPCRSAAADRTEHHLCDTPSSTTRRWPSRASRSWSKRYPWPVTSTNAKLLSAANRLPWPNILAMRPLNNSEMLDSQHLARSWRRARLPEMLWHEAEDHFRLLLDDLMIKREGPTPLPTKRIPGGCSPFGVLSPWARGSSCLHHRQMPDVRRRESGLQASHRPSQARPETCAEYLAKRSMRANRLQLLGGTRSASAHRPAASIRSSTSSPALESGQALCSRHRASPYMRRRQSDSMLGDDMSPSTAAT